MHHRRGPWSNQEDAQLLHLVQIHGAHNWVRISSLLNSRTPKQCRERYHQNLKPTLNHEPITPEEGARIERLVAEMGKRWAEIARHLNGRSDNAVKNWWNGGQNRRKRITRRHGDRYSGMGHQHHGAGDILASAYSTPSPLPPRHLTIDIHRRASYDSMLSPTYTDASGVRTPSVASDASSTFSISPRAPFSPLYSHPSNYQQYLGVQREYGHALAPIYRAPEPVTTHHSSVDYTPRYEGDRLHSFEYRGNSEVKLPSLAQFAQGAPATQTKDERMKLSSLLG